MKLLQIAFTLIFLTATGLSQGRIGLQNPATAPVTLSSVLRSGFGADAALAGMPVGNSSPLPSGKVLAIGLYAGTDQYMMSYCPGRSGTALLNNPIGTPGLVPLQQIEFANILANVVLFGQIKVWDNAYGSFELAMSGGSGYVGESPVFSFTTKTTYASIAPNVPAVPIVVGAMIPEPAVSAIVGLGLGSMLLFRRRRT